MDYTKLIIVLIVMLINSCVYAVPNANPRKVVICTDIASDIDDSWALAFAMKCPELAIDSVVVSHGPTPGRAKVAAKLLSIGGFDDVPVMVGKAKRNTPNGQRDWAKDFVPKRPLVADAARSLARRIMRMEGKVTLIPIGPLTDIGEMLRLDPGVRDKIDEILLMGGAVYNGYRTGSEVCAEYNILSNVKAAQRVFESGIPIVLVGLDVTRMMQPSAEDMQRIAESNRPLPQAMHTLYKLWEHPTPTLFDVVAIALAFHRDLVEMDYLSIEVTSDGITRIVPNGKPNAWVCKKIDKQRTMMLFMDRVMQ